VSGPVHFRRTGRITGFRSDSAAASGPRRLRIRVAGWGEPAQVHARGVGGISLAWYVRGCVALYHHPEFRLRHGGPRLGQTVALLEGPIGLDAVVNVDQGQAGDDLLVLVDSGTPIPVSATFEGSMRSTEYHTGRRELRFDKGLLTEISVVESGAFGTARVLGRTTWPAP